MKKQFRFPIKGTFYYDAPEAFALGELSSPQALCLVAEPNNPHDAFAVQIWTTDPPQQPAKLLGYLPRLLSQSISPLLPVAAVQLIDSRLKGRFLLLTVALETDCSVFLAWKILWLSAYVSWRYRLKSWVNRLI